MGGSDWRGRKKRGSLGGSRDWLVANAVVDLSHARTVTVALECHCFELRSPMSTSCHDNEHLEAGEFHSYELKMTQLVVSCSVCRTWVLCLHVLRDSSAREVANTL